MPARRTGRTGVAAAMAAARRRSVDSDDLQLVQRLPVTPARLSAGRCRAAARAGSAGRPAPGSPGRVAAHIRGNIDVGVKPGIVLISLTTSEPSGITKKSTRARPSQPTRLERARGQLAQLGGDVVRAGRRARRARCAPRGGTWRRSRRTRGRRRPGSRRARWSRGCRRGPASTPHSTSRAPSAATARPAPWGRGGGPPRSRRRARRRRATLEIPMLEPPRAGFTNSG